MISSYYSSPEDLQRARKDGKRTAGDSSIFFTGRDLRGGPGTRLYRNADGTASSGRLSGRAGIYGPGSETAGARYQLAGTGTDNLAGMVSGGGRRRPTITGLL